MSVTAKTYYVLLSREQLAEVSVGQVVQINNLNYYDNYLPMISGKLTFEVEDREIAQLIKRYRVYPQLLSGYVEAIEDNYAKICFKYYDLTLWIRNHPLRGSEELPVPTYFISEQPYVKGNMLSYQNLKCKVSQLLDVGTHQVATSTVLLTDKPQFTLIPYSTNIKAGTYELVSPLNLDGKLGFVTLATDD